MGKATLLPVLVERYRTQEGKRICRLLGSCRNTTLMPLILSAHYRRLVRKHKKGNGRTGVRGTKAMQRMLELEIAASMARAKQEQASRVPDIRQ